MPAFNLKSPFAPCGDQPKAIAGLVDGLRRGERHQTLLGVTGSGKTFTMAHVIASMQRPTLVMAPNKTLAAQLYSEFRELFPENAVEYFVSYYDYYQPEAYIPRTDVFIEKDSSLNENIDKMRHAATRALLERRDVIIVASVSCIYGLGSPEAYHGMLIDLQQGKNTDRDEVLRHLVAIQYQRNDYDFHRGTFRVRGEVVEIFPAYEEDRAVRLEFFGDEIEKITIVDALKGNLLETVDRIPIYPASHYVTPESELKRAIQAIAVELQERVAYFKGAGKLLEAQRIEQRTHYDLEMIEEIGFCKGIENYSRHLTGRAPGQPPPTLIEYFPQDYLLIIDESHVTVPQTGGMSHGDRSRKQTLVDYGFRLPSALDNRPLTFVEFENLVHQALYVSATPGPYELKQCRGQVVEQVIRPTGLTDPALEVHAATEQIGHLLVEIKATVAKGQRVLITTLTKRSAENLAEFLQKEGMGVRYLHAEIDTLERFELIRDLRLGKFDVLVGINLLREGLDLPEVALVAILDADKEGFLRSERSLIQTFGRAARHLEGRVILYADTITSAMRGAIDETSRRRHLQEAFNRRHGITPRTIVKDIRDSLYVCAGMDYLAITVAEVDQMMADIPAENVEKLLLDLEQQMKNHAKHLEFEAAAKIRDRIKALQERRLALGS